MPEPALDIRPEHLRIVQDILQAHIPQHTVRAFGSRVKQRAKRYSDLDLAIITDTPLPLPVQAALVDAFSESDLLWKVDIVDWASTHAAFRDIIRRQHIILQQPA
ncbi:nucleotidyltransferase domain-containing protein [uncultured Cardiobacterium sp.]|uniref:nucleotidyltransferase family protein n=1 Tax=uncultured Cardiobacterium sp. TaxID=417619 RepID=UPI002632FF8E|nr:nucleotidyltransferase domain-containing protein [uncultured Cardiobacterium sp.]